MTVVNVPVDVDTVAAEKDETGGLAVSGVELFLLNEFHLCCRGTNVTASSSVQRLLVLLAVLGRPTSRSRVAGTLWMDATEDRATANLRSTLWRIPASIRSAVTVTGTMLSLASDVSVDARKAEAFGRRVISLPVASHSVGGLDEAAAEIALLACELLPDWYDDWILVERERLRNLRLHALEALSRNLVAAGRFGEAVEAGLIAVAGEPLRESAHRCVVSAHIREGNHGEALRQFQAFRVLLYDELGLSPTKEMFDLVRPLMGSDDVR